MRILVDKDWCSPPLWVPSDTGGWAACEVHNFDLPKSIIERLEFYSLWHDCHLPGNQGPEQGWQALHQYKLALAIDIKRHFKESAQIFIYNGEAIAEVTGQFDEMFRTSP